MPTMERPFPPGATGSQSRSYTVELEIIIILLTRYLHEKLYAAILPDRRIIGTVHSPQIIALYKIIDVETLPVLIVAFEGELNEIV